MISRLLAYPAIAWDFDGTLIDHPKSSLMHEFIIAHPEKRHVILTFRTHGLQRMVFRELEDYPDAPGLEAFDGVYNISDLAWQKFTDQQMLRQFRRYDGPLTPWEEYYVEWKGMACHEHHLPVLIDDKAEHVLPGCERYHIAYLHPDDL